MIIMTLALPLLLPLALTTFFAPYSSRELFTEFKEPTKFKKLQPISSNFCVLTVDISYAHLLAPPLLLFLPPENHSISFGKLSFGSLGASTTTLIGFYPGLLLLKASHRVLFLYKPPTLITSSLQRLCCVKQLCNHGSLEESWRFPSFLWMTSGAR